MNAAAEIHLSASAGDLHPTIRAIVAAVCEHCDVSRVDLLSPRRSNSVVRPRQIAMWLARSLTTASLPEIGRRLGGRDHTTILHGVRTIDRLYETDAEIRTSVEAIALALGILVRAGRPVELMQDDDDPLETALQIVTTPTAAIATSVDAIEAMARCLVGYAMRVGALRIDGDEPDPELLPIERAPVVSADDARRVAVLRRLRTAWRTYESARWSRHERAALDAVLQAVRAATKTIPEEA